MDVKDEVAANKRRDAESEHKRGWSAISTVIYRTRANGSENSSADLPPGRLLTRSRFSAALNQEVAAGGKPTDGQKRWGAHGESQPVAEGFQASKAENGNCSNGNIGV